MTMPTPAEPLVDGCDSRPATLAGELLANASLEVALREASKLPEAWQQVQFLERLSPVATVTLREGERVSLDLSK